MTPDLAMALSRAELAGELAAELGAALDPMKVILFGSVARGEDGPDSDVDLLVVMDHAPADRRRTLEMQGRRALRCRAGVDVHVTDLAEIARRGHLRSWFVHPALHGEGVVLYQRGADMPCDEAERWLRLGRGDLRAAEILLADPEGELRIVVFQAQQAAEKALKAVLAAHDLPIPKVHELTELLDRLPIPAPVLDRGELGLLSPWARQGRYGGDGLTRQEATALLGSARRTLAAAEALVVEAPEPPAPSTGQ